MMTATEFQTAMPRSWKTSHQWFRTGLWAISDQALFALSNFTLNILLARLLAPAEYGVFAVVYSIFLLLSLVHAALVVEPMLVFGAGKYQFNKAPYWRALRFGHWAISICGSVILVLASLILWPFTQSALPTALLMLAFASPFMLLVVLARRACYVYLEPRLAALSGLIYLALVMVGTFMLSLRSLLTPASALALMGAGSLVSAVYLMIRLRDPNAPEDPIVRPEAMRDHWQYGRWAIGASTVSWIPSYVFYLALPLAGGLESTAALRALTNFIQPVQHTYVAVSGILVPHLVRVRGTARWRSALTNAFVLFGILAAVFWLFLGTQSGALIALLYGGKYGTHAPLLWIIGLAPIAGAGVAIAGSALRALERPNLIFWSYVVSAAIALVIGMGLLLAWGVAGAAVAIVLCAITTCASMIFLLVRNSTMSAVRGIS